MSDSKSSNSGGGITITGLLGVVFITLKLTGYIDWPWWVVLSPFWAGLVVAAVLFLVVGILALLNWILK